MRGDKRRGDTYSGSIGWMTGSCLVIMGMGSGTGSGKGNTTFLGFLRRINAEAACVANFIFFFLSLINFESLKGSRVDIMTAIIKRTTSNEMLYCIRVLWTFFHFSKTIQSWRKVVLVLGGLGRSLWKYVLDHDDSLVNFL